MGIFLYKAIDKKGVIKKGKIAASDVFTAHKILKEKGFFVINLKNNSPEKKSFAFKKRVKIVELAFFCEYLSIMLSSGIPLLDALKIIEKELNNIHFKNSVKIIKKDLRAGYQLYQSMERHAHIFPKMMLAMVEAGEYAGELDEVFRRLSIHFYYEHKTLGKVKSALTYPLIVLLVAFGTIILMLTIVIPSFSGLIKDLDLELPFLTKIVIKVSDLIISRWYLLILLPIIGGYIFMKIYSTEKGKYLFDKYILKLPFLGEILKKIYLVRFTKTLGSLLNSGVIILDALEIAAKTVDSEFFLESTEKVKKAIKNGQGLADSFKKAIFFPRLLTQIITIGEETAQLPELLLKIGSYYEEEVNIKTDKVATLLEPALLIFLGGIVCFIIFTIILPIFSVLGAIS